MVVSHITFIIKILFLYKAIMTLVTSLSSNQKSMHPINSVSRKHNMEARFIFNFSLNGFKFFYLCYLRLSLAEIIQHW